MSAFNLPWTSLNFFCRVSVFLRVRGKGIRPKPMNLPPGSAPADDVRRRQHRLSVAFGGLRQPSVAFAKYSRRLAYNRRVDLWRNSCTSLLYFVVCVRCRRKESSLKERFVIFKEEWVGGRATVTIDEERVLWQGWTEIELFWYWGWLVVRSL